MINQHASNLVDITVKAFNGDVTSISILDSISLIDSWVSFLKSEDQPANAIADSLINLRAELNNTTPNGEHVERILKSLIDQTKQLTKATDEDTQPKLKSLSTALQAFNQQVSGTSKRANTGGQAPITSTVGGESTNSGAGASALGETDDDLSNRNGGTTSSGPTVNMADSTDNSGPSTTGNASGGTGDSATAQSGGRSQY